MKSQFVLSIWGQQYLDLFSKATLPSLLTPGNLLGFGSEASEFDIYTTRESRAELVRMPIISALEDLMPVRYTIMERDDTTDEDKYLGMNEGHVRATLRSAEIESAMYFLAPDAVWADGTLTFARDVIDSGKRAVLLPGERVASIPFLSDAIARFNPSHLFDMRISPRELVELFLRHPHDCQQYLIWGNQPYTRHPSHLLFPIADEGYIVRGFHHHPLAVYPRVRAVMPQTTLDGRWLIDAVPNLEDWFLIIDTDNGCAFDIGTAPGHCSGAEVERDPVTFVAGWMSAYADAGHRWNASRSVNLHHGELSSIWPQEESRVEQLVESLFSAEINRRLLFRTCLYRAANTAETERIIVWGAGKAAESLVSNLDPANIDFVIDSDSVKHGSTCLGVPVRAPEVLLKESGRVVLISSPKYDASIRRQIRTHFSSNVKIALSARDVLDCLP